MDPVEAYAFRDLAERAIAQYERLDSPDYWQNVVARNMQLILDSLGESDTPQQAENGNASSSSSAVLQIPDDELKIPDPIVVEGIVKDRIGKGGFATVYCSTLTINGKEEKVALKNVRNKSSFDREVNIFKKVDLLFIVHFFGISASGRYIVMEYCETNLKDFVLKEMRPSSVDRSIIGQLAVALGYLHSKDIKHGDMKQENVLLKVLDPSCIVVKLADFGFSRQLQPGQGSFDQTTNLGTLGFIAPESKDGESPSFASDVWSLGVVIFFVLSNGQHPYQLPGRKLDINYIQYLSESLKSVLNMKTLREQWTEVDLIYRLLQNDPSNRPSVFLVPYHPFFSLSNKNAMAQLASKASNLCSRCYAPEMEVLQQCFQESNIRKWYDQVEHQFKAVEDSHVLEDLAKKLPSAELPDSSEMMAAAKIDIGSQVFFASAPFDSLKSKMFFADKVKHAPPDIINQLTFSIKQSLLDMFQFGDQLFIPYLWASLAELKLDNKTFAQYFQVTDYEFIMVHNSVGDFEKILDYSKRITNHSFKASSRNSQALNWALSYGASIDVVRLLLEHGADAKLKDSTGREPVLQISQTGNSAEMLSLLVEHGADIHIVDQEGSSLLHWAVNNPNIDIAKWLVDNKVNPNARKKNGVQPIHLAVRQDCTEHIARFLLDHGANADAMDDNYQNVLHWAAACNTKCELFQLLLEKEIDVNRKNRDGESPLHYAVINNSNVKIMELLLENGADVNSRNHHGAGPIHRAVVPNFYPEKIRMLLKYNADVNLQSYKGDGPLHWILEESRNIEIIRLLLQNKADPNLRNTVGRTPLHVAAEHCSDYDIQIFELLFQYGANSDLEDANNLKPLHLAKKHITNTAILNLLGE